MTQSLKAPSSFTLGFILAIASAALFSIRPVFVKLVYAENVDPTTLIGLRMLFSLPFYLLMLLLLLRDPAKRLRLSPRLVATTMLLGLAGYYSASFLDLLGLQYVTAQLGRMILYIYPTLVVILSAFFFAQKITARLIIAMLITYCGVAIIFAQDLRTFGDEVITGALFILASALSFACYLAFSKGLIDQLGSRLFTSIALISACIGILIHYSITHSITHPQVNQTALFGILIIAVFCTVIPSFLTTAAVERIGSSNVSVIAMIGPAFTSVFAVLVINEAFTVYHFIGISLSIWGIWVLRKA